MALDDDESYYSPEEGKLLEQEPAIAEASYSCRSRVRIPEPEAERWTLAAAPPRKTPELKNVPTEQAKHIWLKAPSIAVWQLRIDDGRYHLSGFLEYRRGKAAGGAAAQFAGRPTI